MAQVMVNFRMDENVKKCMEQACREMGLSMTTAFTIFATKVGREKRIPFEITAEPYGPQSRRGRPREEEALEEGPSPLMEKRERLEALCAEIRQSLTAVHTAVPSSITGLSMERIRLLCGDELKDKAAGITGSAKSLFSARNAETLKTKDLGVLDEYLDGLADIAEDLRDLQSALIPAMKSWTGGDAGAFAPYAQRLAAVSRKFDELPSVMQRFWASSAQIPGSARTVQARIRRAAPAVETPYVLTALEGLESLIARHYDALDGPTKARVEAHYLQTLELTLEELGRAEQSGEDPAGKATLCLRAAGVLSQVLSGGGRARQEQSRRSLEAEVTALERLAALRGDVPGGAGPEA